MAGEERVRSGLSIEQEELRGISRTVAEIHWLLLILVLVYLVFGGERGDPEANALVRRQYREGHWATPKGA